MTRFVLSPRPDRVSSVSVIEAKRHFRSRRFGHVHGACGRGYLAHQRPVQRSFFAGRARTWPRGPALAVLGSMPTPRPCLLLAPFVLAAAMSAGDARAAETSIALDEVAVPPVSSGVDRAMLQTAAEGALRGVDASRLR